MKRIPLWVLSQRKLRKQHDQNSPIKKAAENYGQTVEINSKEQHYQNQSQGSKYESKQLE